MVDLIGQNVGLIEDMRFFSFIFQTSFSGKVDGISSGFDSSLRFNEVHATFLQLNTVDQTFFIKHNIFYKSVFEMENKKRNNECSLILRVEAKKKYSDRLEFIPKTR